AKADVMLRQQGFSLGEMIVAMAIMLTVTTAVFGLVNPAQGGFAGQLERTDMQQRLRVASDAILKELIMVGAGAYQGANTGPLIYFFAPVLPFRQDDAAGSFRTDSVTLMHVPET